MLKSQVFEEQVLYMRIPAAPWKGLSYCFVCATAIWQVFEELYDYCCAVAGASLHAADRLCRGEADVAINWGGGRYV